MKQSDISRRHRQDIPDEQSDPEGDPEQKNIHIPRSQLAGHEMTSASMSPQTKLRKQKAVAHSLRAMHPMQDAPYGQDPPADHNESWPHEAATRPGYHLNITGDEMHALGGMHHPSWPHNPASAPGYHIPITGDEMHALGGMHHPTWPHEKATRPGYDLPITGGEMHGQSWPHEAATRPGYHIGINGCEMHGGKYVHGCEACHYASMSPTGSGTVGGAEGY